MSAGEIVQRYRCLLFNDGDMLFDPRCKAIPLLSDRSPPPVGQIWNSACSLHCLQLNELNEMDRNVISHAQLSCG